MSDYCVAVHPEDRTSVYTTKQPTRTNIRILVVVDDRAVASFIRKGLEKAFYEVHVVSTWEDALVAALNGQNSFRAMILDLALPDRDGLSIVSEMRERGSSITVLALTARGGVEDCVKGLDHGCDDYLSEPFEFDELLARLRSLQRRHDDGNRAVQLTHSGFTLNPITRHDYREGRPMDLTNTQYYLPDLFLRHQGTVLARSEIISAIWGWDIEIRSNVLNVYINTLRRKIDMGFSRPLLHTAQWGGYKLE